MEAETNFFDSLVEKVERYFSITIKLSKLKSIEKSAGIATLILSRLCIFLVLMIFVVFCCFGLSYYLGELFGKVYYGFFIVSAGFLILAFLFQLFLYKILLKPVGKFFIEILS